MGLDEPSEGLARVGRYEILETLGKGAMGVVYKARDPLLDRIVAVKTLVSPRDGGKRTRRAYLERFEREAKAAAKMQHPSIVTIHDTWQASYVTPSITAVAMPMHAAGNIAASMLLDHLAGSPMRDEVVSEPRARLVVRASTAPPRAL